MYNISYWDTLPTMAGQKSRMSSPTGETTSTGVFFALYLWMHYWVPSKHNRSSLLPKTDSVTFVSGRAGSRNY